MPARFLVLCLLILAQPDALSAQNVPAAPDPARYQWRVFAEDFDNPLYVTHAGDSSGRLFAVEQGGLIWILRDGEVNFDPFLDISSLLPQEVFRGGYSEQGLLGLAFHPGFRENRQFFIHYTDANGDSVLARYQTMADNPDLADPDSAKTVLIVDQPFADHNGGQIAFGPDGYLYIGLGDGGNVNEFNVRSLDPSLLLGKILRLDVDAEPYVVPPDNPFVGRPPYLPEIWALGLRNPWRFSFDRLTGDLYIADVGQWMWEEINVQLANSPGGENYGWSSYEGSHPYPPERQQPVSPVGFTMPGYEYPHSQGCSVTGGYVYRGAALPELQGNYFFGDYCTGFIWTMLRDSSSQWVAQLFMDTDSVITSFGEDEQGELYLTDYKGIIYRLEAAS